MGLVYECGLDDEFDVDRYHFALGINKNILKTVKIWWWNARERHGFIRSEKGRQILVKSGCLVRFLLAQNTHRTGKADYQKEFYHAMAERIRKRVVVARHGYVTVAIIKEC